MTGHSFLQNNKNGGGGVRKTLAVPQSLRVAGLSFSLSCPVGFVFSFIGKEEMSRVLGGTLTISKRQHFAYGEIFVSFEVALLKGKDSLESLGRRKTQ